MVSEEQVKEAKRWLSTPRVRKVRNSREWMPAVVLMTLFALAAWWWWANYSYSGKSRGESSMILEEMKRGAKGYSDLVVKPNGTVVSR